MDSPEKSEKRGQKGIGLLIGTIAILFFGFIGFVCLLGVPASRVGSETFVLLVLAAIFLTTSGLILRELLKRPVNESPPSLVEQPVEPIAKGKPWRPSSTVTLIIIGLGIYVAYVSGFLKPFIDMLGGGSRVVTSLILEPQCVIEKKSMTSGFTGFFDFTITVSATVKNKMNRTIRAWIRADILNGQKVLFSRIGSIMVPASGGADISIEFPEAEMKDQNLYSHFLVLVDRIE